MKTRHTPQLLPDEEEIEELEDVMHEVHFYCEDCKIPWIVRSIDVLKTAMQVHEDGCPLCGNSSSVYLTHTVEESDEKNVDIDMYEFVRFVPFT